MIFSWFTSSSSIQINDSYDPSQQDHLQQLPTTKTLTKEDEGWVQVITATEEKDEDSHDQQVPNGKSTTVNDVDKKEDPLITTTTTNTAISATQPKKISRQQRRYQARLAQQQALKKQKEIAGEEQLMMAMKLGQQRKSRQKQWVDQWIPHSGSIAPASSCLPTRSASLTTGLD